MLCTADEQDAHTIGAAVAGERTDPRHPLFLYRLVSHGAFGVLLFFEPFAALAMVRFIGAVLVLDGCADLVSVLCLTYWVKKAKRGLEAIYDEARYEAAAIEAEGRIQDESEP